MATKTTTKKAKYQADINISLMTPISIADYTNEFYKEYSLYVLQQRALPSYIDGFKVVQRKLICAGLDMAKNKKIKVAELGSSLSSYEYLHGETSAQDALVGMAANWKNNVPLFEGHGNFGTRLIQEPAASRYIYVTLSKKFNDVFGDFEVCDSRQDNPEPINYLPIIPWSLINGISGVAVGFASNILPRDWNDVRQACIEQVSKGKIKTEVRVKYPNFKGELIKIEENKWATLGKVNIEKVGRKNSYVISELPIGYDREKYYNFLLKLKNTNKIVDFDDDCDKDGFRFIIYTNEDQNKVIEKDSMKFFGLIKAETENISTIDEFGQLRLFANVNDLIKDFCNYRLQKTKDALQYTINVYKDKIEELVVKRQFIENVVSGKINLKEYTKKELHSYVSSLGNVKASQADSIISIPSYSFTKDNIIELDKQIEKSKTELKKLEASNEKDIFLDKLKKLNLD